MQPYQEASEEIRRQGETPLRIAKGIASTAGSIAGGTVLAGVGGKVLPLLSKYIPTEMAIKGLSKIDPRLGKFIGKAMEEGYDFDEIRNFIGEKFEESKPSKSVSEKNIVEQYSPELHQFMDQEIKSGRRPIEAGALAENDKRFGKIIQKMVKDHKTPWSGILQSIYGSGEMAKQSMSPQQSVQQPEQQRLMNSAQAAILEEIRKMKQSRGPR